MRAEMGHILHTHTHAAKLVVRTNDLHMASDKFNYILYADDTTVIGNISNFKSINMQSSITDNINIELDKICDCL